MEDPTGSRQQHGEHPVRSRWTPKPEQILILETIFNSGMVNPPKDETVRIRMLLEKFGSVADANVFYWFQNRRSRSRRRQRQVQATLSDAPPPPPNSGDHFDHHAFPAAAATCFDPNSSSSFSNYSTSSGPYSGSSSSSSSSFGVENSSSFFGLPAYPGLMQEFEETPIFSPDEANNSPIQSEIVTVFINGVATEVGRGPLDIKSVFGGDFVLFHCSGVAVEMNEYGFLVQGLQHGESYFLVSMEMRAEKFWVKKWRTKGVSFECFAKLGFCGSKASLRLKSAACGRLHPSY